MNGRKCALPKHLLLNGEYSKFWNKGSRFVGRGGLLCVRA